MRDAGHTPNTENCRLIVGLYDKHVGFCFRIAMQCNTNMLVFVFG
jgi:hypothetical protein